MADSSGESLFKLYRYDPSAAAAAIFVALFLIITILHTYQMRIISANQTPNWTVGPYVQQTLLLLVAPALFAASIYMGLGRIIFLTDGEAHSPIPGKWLTKIFVCGDVVSFVLQGAGGGIMASGTLEALEKGEHIVIGGLVVQIVFFSVFVAVGTIFHYKMRMVPTPTAAQQGLPWQAHMHTLYAASILILVRSLFRLVEYAQGNDGYIVSHEVFLYIFDALLMFAAMAVFAWKHPSEVNALLRGGGNKAVKNVVVVYPIY
ncbi:Protein RTM1 [Lasiodiplodia theobromae]|uniref:Protein RTM1 n=1 Tax=Lasiodiplodia theobromae TaxID=45133 RepID=A0A5N5CZW2_9PEZI|nr:Protein RTM1 [Lasiodiplodia theobromae]